MKTPASLLPDLTTLTERLTTGLADAEGGEGPVRVLKRALPQFMSTFPNEIVTCQLPGGRKRRVFIKYGGSCSHNSFGHRGDIPYEAEVYRRVLQTVPDFRPKFLGAHTDAGTGDTSLFLEYLHRNIRLSDISWRRSMRQPRGMARTARWLAHFHSVQQPQVGDPALSFLKRYDREYYRGWARRTFEFARPLQTQFPWLVELDQWGDAWFAPLLTAPQTVIHGESYAKNVLVRGRDSFVVDWESAAVAAGEVDLAALTDGEGWTAALVRRCEESYQRARWPQGVPAEFKRTLAAARVYLQFRWMGERPDWTVRKKTLWRCDHLHIAARQLGLVN